jgi:hypothetical protein
MLTKLACALLAFAALGSQAPSAPSTSATIDEAAILTVVDRFMEAVSTNDMALMSALRFEGGFNVVERPAAGKTQLVRRVFDAASFKPGNYRERYWDPIVHVRGGIAVVWTPYEFWTDGKTSHCGIDVFDMAKQDGVWKISGMMWTVEPDSCPSLRPTDPSRARPR